MNKKLLALGTFCSLITSFNLNARVRNCGDPGNQSLVTREHCTKLSDSGPPCGAGATYDCPRSLPCSVRWPNSQTHCGHRRTDADLMAEAAELSGGNAGRQNANQSSASPTARVARVENMEPRRYISTSHFICVSPAFTPIVSANDPTRTPHLRIPRSFLAKHNCGTMALISRTTCSGAREGSFLACGLASKSSTDVAEDAHSFRAHHGDRASGSPIPIDFID